MVNRSKCIFEILFVVSLFVGLIHQFLTLSSTIQTVPSTFAKANEVSAIEPVVYLPFVAKNNAGMPPINNTISILIDDFGQPPYPDNNFNRLGGDRGTVNEALVAWGEGRITTTIAAKNIWGGYWMSLNHPIEEALPIDFSAILPHQISPTYQSQITGITAVIHDSSPGKTFRLELKNSGALQWAENFTLTGGQQTIHADLPALGNVNELLWVLDRALEGDYVVVDHVAFSATTSITDNSTSAFVWSYGMLLNNWNPETGLVRDKARNVTGEFDAIQATGTLAAATAVAEQLDIISNNDAIQIVNTISNTLLLELPQFNGLWPHFVEISPSDGITIANDTEWSSVDTAIAAIGLLTAQESLDLDTSGTEQMMKDINWQNLVTEDGISHGYEYDGSLKSSAWDIFGGESWLVYLAYAAATGEVESLTYPHAPTANGSGFIDEMAWLFMPPPSRLDYWGADWASYRTQAAMTQTTYYETNYPSSCFCQLGLFGLSAGEVPDPASDSFPYQAFGVGGQITTNAVDSSKYGADMLDAHVVLPHYSAMIASLHPQEATRMWQWLINSGHFSPLNNVESLQFPQGVNCLQSTPIWNPLKGSWNLSLQTLGLGRHLAERNGQESILWQASQDNQFLRDGYGLLTPNDPRPHLIPKHSKELHVIKFQ